MAAACPVIALTSLSDRAEAWTVAILVEARAGRRSLRASAAARSPSDRHQERPPLETFDRPRRAKVGRRRLARDRRKTAKSISEQLRETIDKSDLSAYALEATDIDRSVLSLFLNGRRSITLETLDELARHVQALARGTMTRRGDCPRS